MIMIMYSTNIRIGKEEFVDLALRAVGWFI